MRKLVAVWVLGLGVVGFALSTYPVAVECGWMTRAEAIDRALVDYELERQPVVERFQHQAERFVH